MTQGVMVMAVSSLRVTSVLFDGHHSRDHAARNKPLQEARNTARIRQQKDGLTRPTGEAWSYKRSTRGPRLKHQLRGPKAVRYVTDLHNDGGSPILGFANQAFPIVLDSQLVEFSKRVMDLMSMRMHA